MARLHSMHVLYFLNYVLVNLIQPPGNPNRSCVGWIGILIYRRGLYNYVIVYVGIDFIAIG